MSNNFEHQPLNEGEASVEELRARLDSMRRLMSERRATNNSSEVLWRSEHRFGSGIIDGSFLSLVFGGALVVIVTVSVYAFYNLYHAILKKFPSQHTEL